MMDAFLEILRVEWPTGAVIIFYFFVFFVAHRSGKASSRYRIAELEGERQADKNKIAELSRRLGKHAAICTKCGYYVDAQDANKEAKTRIAELEEEIEDAKGGQDKCSWGELSARWNKTIDENSRLNNEISEWRNRDWVTTRELNLCRERIAELEAEVTRLRKAIEKHKDVPGVAMLGRDFELYKTLDEK